MRDFYDGLVNLKVFSIQKLLYHQTTAKIALKVH